MTHWLKNQGEFPKIFWKKRGENEAFLAAGEVARFEELTKLDSGEKFFVVKGWKSDYKKKIGHVPDLFSSFPSPLFLLPKHTHTASFHPTIHPLPRCISRIDTPTLPEWKTNIEYALSSIDQKQIQKVVLARRTTLTFASPLDPFALLETLAASTFNTTLFLFQPSSHTTFLGATPEHLYERKKNMLHTEAIAGTRRRGKTPEEDQLLAQELLSSSKDRLEVEIVKDFLQKKLSSFAHSINAQNANTILKNTHVQHLHHRLSAYLHPNITDTDLLQALHPTPAVGGLPSPEALLLISELENFERGWYASPLGWISEQESSFAVAIRSALIENNQIHLFAAVGIVPGSNAEKEWEECDHKIKPFTELLS